MTYTISKTFEFSASHQLRGLPEDHPCSRLHGHNYKLRVELSGPEVDRRGFLFDYRDLAPFKAWVDDMLDHRHLNDSPLFAEANPTAEHLSFVLVGVVRRTIVVPDGVTVRVHVSETPKTWAVWSPS